MPSQLGTPSLGPEGTRLVGGKTKKSKMGTTMKWPPFLSTFVLNKMCELIASGVRTNKGFKEVHLNAVAKLVFEFSGQEVTPTQIYNHPRKWRVRWIKVSKLKDLSGALWDEDTHIIILEVEHLKGHIMVSLLLYIAHFLTVSHVKTLLTVILFSSLGSPQ